MNRFKCDKCNDSGWITITKNSKEYLQKCTCKKNDHFIEKSEKANIPSRFSGSELSGFLPGNNNDSLKNIKNIVKKFVDDYPTGQ
ncbi:MAG: hypothetical protein ABFR75_08390, partial [Acidobacteriota bacterium]